jgi:hypothetical protein
MKSRKASTVDEELTAEEAIRSERYLVNELHGIRLRPPLRNVTSVMVIAARTILRIITQLHQ